MNKHRRECRSLCEAGGLHVLHVQHLSKHLAVMCAEGMVIMPSTPSDRRWRYNASAFIRRLAKNG